MTNKQENEKKAIAQATSQPESDNVDTRKGDYTKFFYRNIERLWDAVMQLQEENSRLKTQLKNASVVLNGGQ